MLVKWFHISSCRCMVIDMKEASGFEVFHMSNFQLIVTMTELWTDVN